MQLPLDAHCTLTPWGLFVRCNSNTWREARKGDRINVEGFTYRVDDVVKGPPGEPVV